MNRDYLPRLCMNVNNERRGGFVVKFIFNDYHLTAESSLFAGSAYRVRLYNYSFADVPSYYSLTGGKQQLSRVGRMRLMRELAGGVKADEEIEERLSSGLYILELQLNQTSRLCPLGLCVDEAAANNRVQCSPCMKLVGQWWPSL